MNSTGDIEELGRLRNRHVAKILTFLGDAPPYLETAIKKQFTLFADDIEANIINRGRQDYERQQRLDKTTPQHHQ